MKKILIIYPILQNILYVKKKITQYVAVKSDFYSPLPEYPADCRSAAKIPPSGAAGIKGKVNRTTCLDGVLTKSEAHQSEGGLFPLYHFNVGMATAQFRFDTLQFVGAQRRSRPAGLRGASLLRGLQQMMCLKSKIRGKADLRV